MTPDSRKISEIRNDYRLKDLDEKDVNRDPLAQLQQWVDDAIESKIYEVTAMHLSTVSSQGKPSSRIMLLKGVDNKGLIFFTNYKSRKGKELSSNPHTAATFFWPELERQIRIEGVAEKISFSESKEYFCTRPRGSQLGAVISPQSQKITDRKFLESAIQKAEKKYKDQEIPCPEHWGGFRLVPEYFEFWQGRPDRLHDRIIYYKESGSWKKGRLAP